MKPSIKHPKVFISYAWNSEDYQSKVISLASRLKDNGVEVILDKWNLREGNDMYAFMERSVTDDSVTNVLILLDPTYAKKANKRAGGVGTETQIMSPDIYQKVKQTKIIPVVFQRDENNCICKPTYLNTILHFDLSMPESFEREYQRMVRSLYGYKTYKEPELGTPPVWLDEEYIVDIVSVNEYDNLKKNDVIEIKRMRLQEYLSKMSDEILSFHVDDVMSEMTSESYGELYKSTQPLRDKFLILLKASISVQDSHKQVFDMLEKMLYHIKHDILGFRGDALKTLLHELFLYIVSFYLKNKYYAALQYIFIRKYFINGIDHPEGFDCFYHYDRMLADFENKKDNKKYYAAIAHYWLEHINSTICSKDDFVLADELCFNVSLFHPSESISFPYWFPISYVYDSGHACFLGYIAHLKSKDKLNDIAKTFGYDKVDEFKNKYYEIEEKNDKTLGGYSYSESFEVAPCMMFFVKSSELGIYP